MATHFDVLGKETPKSSREAVATPSVVQPAITSGTGGGLPTSMAQPIPIEDPKVQAAFQDLEVQSLIAALRAGQQLEMHDLCRRNPRLFEKVKVLLDAGLLSME